MNTRTALLLQLGILVFAVAYSLWMSGHMPNVVPIHWGADGRPNGYGSKYVNLWMLPGTLLVVTALTFLLPAISPRGFSIERFGGVYHSLMVVVALLMAAIHVVVLQASAGAKIDIGRALFAIVFVFFALMGNLLGKVRQNFFVGVRTPWTLASERVWEETHRRAAYVWFFGGILGAGLSLAGASFEMSVGLLLVLAFIPVVDSYFLYRKQGA